MNEIVILGGPNGAGKTTAARVLLREFLDLHTFVNADELARGINSPPSDLTGFAAGRLMLQRMRELIENGSSFAFETTCAGKSYAQLLSQCRTLGWRITLIYLWLPSPETAIARVARRVREGGHDVPAEVIRRRFRAGLLNLRELYLPLAHEARIYDNESEERTLIAEKHLDSAIIIHDESRWTPIRELTR